MKKRIKEAEKKLKEVQIHEHDAVMLEQCATITMELDTLHRLEES